VETPPKKKFGKSNSEQLELKFEPSTKQDVKEYVRKAAEYDEEKKNKVRTKKEKLQLNNVELPFDNFKAKAFRRMFKEVMHERTKKHLADKKNNGRWSPRFPYYEMFEPQKIADSNFVHDIQSCIAGFSWAQIARLINAAAGEEIVLKDWTEGFSILQTLMHKALGVELDSTAARYRLADRDKVLEEWQVEIIERKRKMSKRDDDNGEEVRKSKVVTKEEDDEGETGAEASEEEDADEEEDEDEDEEKPAKKKSKSKPKKKKAADKDDAEDEEEESSDDDDEDADEDEDEDEDEDGDDEPKVKKSRGKKSVATKAKSKKSEKVEKPAKKKTTRASRNPDAVYKVKKKFGSGVRQQCIDVIPAKGATVEVIGAAMKKKFDVDPKKARSYVSWLTANGYLTRIDD
jgi:hypothetical protein